MKSVFTPLAAAMLLAGSYFSPLEARTDFNDVGYTMAIMLQDKHFDGANSDPNLANKVLDVYFDSLDPEKLYFLSSDVAEFQGKYGAGAPNAVEKLLLRRQIMTAARDVHTRYTLRVKERLAFANQLITNAFFDFTKDDATPITRAEAEWPHTSFEAQEVWRKRIAGQLLAEDLERETIARLAKEQDKRDPFSEKKSPRETIKESYQHLLKTILAANEEDVAAGILSAVALAHDPHTDYLSKLETEAFDRDLRNQLTGIGAQLKSEADGTTRITGIVVDGPAQRQGGLQLNDRIVAVDPLNDGNPVDILFMPSDRVVDLILGKKGSEVGLIVRNRKTVPAEPKEEVEEEKAAEEHPEEATAAPLASPVAEETAEAPTPAEGDSPLATPLFEEPEPPLSAVDAAFPDTHRIVIKRDVVNIKSGAAAAELVRVTQPDGTSQEIGWITFPSFYYDFADGDPSVFKDVRRLVSRLMKEGVEAIGLDLRDNGGGSLTEVAKMAGIFVGNAPVVQSKDRDGNVDALTSEARTALYKGPLLVAIDKYSASASEILAGVLQDYNRAVVVGDSSTFGKGTVQWKMDIGRFFNSGQDASRAGELKLTVEKFYRVNGSSTQLEGVVPDIVFPALTDAQDVGESSLKYALPHDLIPPAKGFKPFNHDSLFISALSMRSVARVAASRDFAYEKEDVERLKERIEANLLSLNIDQRREELASNEERRLARNKERRERFAQQESDDRSCLTFLRLTLDDLKRETLTPVDRERDAQSSMILAPDEFSDLTNTPKWPSGLDPVRRESLHILLDLIEFTDRATLAKAERAQRSERGRTQ